MNTHIFLFRVTTAEKRLLNAQGVGSPDWGVQMKESFKPSVINKMAEQLKVTDDVSAMKDDEILARLEVARTGVLADLDQTAEHLNNQFEMEGLAATAEQQAYSETAVIQERLEQGGRLNKRLGRNAAYANDLAAVRSRVRGIHAGQQGTHLMRLAALAAPRKIVERIRARLARAPLPSVEETRQELQKQKVDMEQRRAKLEETKSRETNQKIAKMNLTDDVKKDAMGLPVNIRAAAADSFLSEFPLIVSNPGFAAIVSDPAALSALRKAMTEEGISNTGNTALDKKVNDFLGGLQAPEKKSLLTFLSKLDAQTSQALNDPEKFGTTPEQQKAHIAQRIEKIKKILAENSDVLTNPESKPAGELMMQKGLLMMAGVDVSKLEGAGNWEKIETDPVPMYEENSAEAKMARFGGLLLFCIGLAQWTGQSLKNATNKKPSAPTEDFSKMENDVLEKQLDEANKKKMPSDKVKELEQELVGQRDKLAKAKDGEKEPIEKEIQKLMKQIEEQEMLAKKVQELEAEQQRRVEQIGKAKEWLKGKGVTLEKAKLSDPCVLTFPKDNFANPWGTEEGTKKFDGKLPVSFTGTGLSIGETIIGAAAPFNGKEDIVVTEKGKQEVVYATHYQTVDAYNTARKTDEKAFMRSKVDVRNDEKVFSNEIGLDSNRLAYSPKACERQSYVVATLACGNSTDIPGYVASSVSTDPNTKTLIDTTRTTLAKYQPVFTELTKMTGGKVEVRLWPFSTAPLIKLEDLKKCIESLPTKKNAKKLLEKESYMSITDSKISTYTDYARNDEIVWITENEKIEALIKAINKIVE